MRRGKAVQELLRPPIDRRKCLVCGAGFDEIRPHFGEGMAHWKCGGYHDHRIDVWVCPEIASECAICHGKNECAEYAMTIPAWVYVPSRLVVCEACRERQIRNYRRGRSLSPFARVATEREHALGLAWGWTEESWHREVLFDKPVYLWEPFLCLWKARGFVFHGMTHEGLERLLEEVQTAMDLIKNVDAMVGCQRAVEARSAAIEEVVSERCDECGERIEDFIDVHECNPCQREMCKECHGLHVATHEVPPEDV